MVSEISPTSSRKIVPPSASSSRPGFALAAPMFGALLDHGHPQGVFFGAALLLMMGVASASLVGLRTARGRAAAALA